jgi:hypothetical protein
VRKRLTLTIAAIIFIAISLAVMSQLSRPPLQEHMGVVTSTPSSGPELGAAYALQDGSKTYYIYSAPALNSTSSDDKHHCVPEPSLKVGDKARFRLPSAPRATMGNYAYFEVCYSGHLNNDFYITKL